MRFFGQTPWRPRGAHSAQPEESFGNRQVGRKRRWVTFLAESEPRDQTPPSA